MKAWFSYVVGLSVLGMAATASADPTEPGTLVNPLAPVEDCDYCHTFGNDDAHADDPPFAPNVGWQGSMMGSAARDPVFWAGVAVAEADHPDEVIECVRCHVPRAFLDDRADTITSVDQLTLEERGGVECEVCHRMTDQSFIGNAQYNIADEIVGTGVPRRGPFDYTDGVSLPTEHEVAQDDFTGSSELCGTCHEVTTPRDRVDDDGNSLGIPFNEQRTYSEWLGSAFAQPGADFLSCVDCHMPEVTDSSACLTYVDSQTHPTGNRRHDLIGANRFMLQIIRDNFGDEILPMFLNFAIARLDDFVQTSATLEVTGPDSVHLAEPIEGIEVTVTNETGHKLPSGYSEGRIMWIEVIASYQGQPVGSSGFWDGEAIQDDAQLRTYQGVAEQFSSGETFHLLLNNHWVEDTRIPPRGLLQNIETDPVGDRYELQADNTWPHWDSATYDFPAAPDITDSTDEDFLDVRVRLLYVINTAEYIDFLAEQSDAGMEVATMFDLAGGAPPVELATVDLQIPIEGFGDGGSSGDTTTGMDTSATSPGSTSAATVGPTSTLSAGTDATTTDDTTAAADGGGNTEGCGCKSEPTPRGAGVLFVIAALGFIRRGRFGRSGTSRQTSTTA